MAVNKFIGVGNLGKDPELRYTGSGQAVCSFSIAITEKFKGKDGEQQERTEWVACVAWGALAEVCGKWLTKGKQVFVEGRLQTRSYDDKEGNKRYVTEVVLSAMQMLGTKGESSSRSDAPPAGSRQPAQSQPATMPDRPDRGFDPDDDIPFSDGAESVIAA